jgi:hypothetical protein
MPDFLYRASLTTAFIPDNLNREPSLISKKHKGRQTHPVDHPLGYRISQTAMIDSADLLPYFPCV